MGERISFEVEDGSAEGYVARPEGDPSAGIVVLQEWWGLVPHIEDVADRLAAEGYLALAPDLYHGKTTVEVEEAEHLMSDLDWGRAVKEIQAAVKTLRGREGCARVGIVGFCMGGALACLGAATAGPDAAVAFYGFPPPPHPMDTECPPTKLFFGSDEPFFDVDAAEEWTADQRARGVEDTEVRVYEGAGHAFFNDTRPEAYVKEAAQDAWARTLEHFAKYLR